MPGTAEPKTPKSPGLREQRARLAEALYWHMTGPHDSDPLEEFTAKWDAHRALLAETEAEG